MLSDGGPCEQVLPAGAERLDAAGAVGDDDVATFKTGFDKAFEIHQTLVHESTISGIQFPNHARDGLKDMVNNDDNVARHYLSYLK